MATTDRQATTPALAHALPAAERGLAAIPLSRTKLPALRSPHRDGPAPAAAHGPAPTPAPAYAPGPAPCHGECGRSGHGVYDASADPARIRELFAAAHNCRAHPGGHRPGSGPTSLAPETARRPTTATHSTADAIRKGRLPATTEMPNLTYNIKMGAICRQRAGSETP